MTSHTRPSRVAEWAELVGDRVPDVVCDVDAAAAQPSAGRPTDDRWTATQPSNSQSQ
ncbi:hypothetical protein [Salinigranum halophilum]|jgi:hypothetical protein|uniref:hypothetical protein n=1 Tax=Salinigranum halophilum TaxID=2565931 RepID=UPI001375517E|nr:hypothetical protein [Salinigranum halophilum]